jgi:hypothetical protein
LERGALLALALEKAVPEVLLPAVGAGRALVVAALIGDVLGVVTLLERDVGAA